MLYYLALDFVYKMIIIYNVESHSEPSIYVRIELFLQVCVSLSLLKPLWVRVHMLL